MESTDDAATMDADAEADAAEDTTTLAQTAHPRKVSAQTWVTLSFIVVTSQGLIR